MTDKESLELMAPKLVWTQGGSASAEASEIAHCPALVQESTVMTTYAAYVEKFAKRNFQIGNEWYS